MFYKMVYVISKAYGQQLHFEDVKLLMDFQLVSATKLFFFKRGCILLFYSWNTDN